MSGTIYGITCGFTINDTDELPEEYKGKGDDEIIAEIQEVVHEALMKWHREHPGVLDGDPV